MEEIWKDVPGYEDKYQVSNLGRIKSMDYMHTGKEHIRKGSTTRCGYQIIDLWKDGVSTAFSIHRLVWSAFNGPIPEDMQVNHINEDKTDNRLENLNLMTCSDNNLWGTKRKRMIESRKGYGKRKPVCQYGMDGKFIREWESGQEIKRQLGYSQGNIASCCRGELAYAYGYKWKYKDAI